MVVFGIVVVLAAICICGAFYLIDEEIQERIDRVRLARRIRTILEEVRDEH